MITSSNFVGRSAGSTSNLRKKIELDASMPRHLITEADIGYRFVP
jgi:DNA-binding response OmpR family regulator